MRVVAQLLPESRNMKIVRFLLLISVVNGMPYYYSRDRRAKRSDLKVSPAMMPFVSSSDSALHRSPSEARMLGLDTGNEAADFEAGIWLMALIGTLAAAVPVAFLNPSLGFRKRSADDNNFVQSLSDQVSAALHRLK